MKEGDAQRAICDDLDLRRHLFWRANNVPVFDRTRGALPKYTVHGLPDIMVMKNGFFIGLEVKATRQKHRGNLRGSATEHDGQYFVVARWSMYAELGCSCAVLTREAVELNSLSGGFSHNCSQETSNG